MATSNGRRKPASPLGEPLRGARKVAPRDTPKVTPPAGRSKALPDEIKLRELFATLSTGMMVAGDEFSATVIARRTDELAHAWAKLAQQNAAVRRVIKGLLEGSAWGEVMMVTMSVAIPIAYRYAPGIIPDGAGMMFTAQVAPEFITFPESPEQAAHRAQQEGAKQPSDTQPQPRGDSNPGRDS
jgi:hypothetical protein